MIKLIAIGNRLMKDDGIAIAVTEYLREKLEALGTQVIIGETDFESCFHLLNEGDFVLILDALNMEEGPGSIHIYNLQKSLSSSARCNTQHDMSIIDLMILYKSTFKGYIIGIEVAEVDMGNELSAILTASFPNICTNVESTIKNIILEELENA